MKKIALSFFIACITFNLTAQILSENPLELGQNSSINIYNPDNDLHIPPKGNPASYVSQTNKQRLDSLVSGPYDQSTMQWQNAFKSTYAYNAQENLSNWILQRWDESTAQWAVYTNFEYLYDENGNLISNFYQNYSWDMPEEITFGIKYERTYDNDNNLITYILHSWDNNQWMLNTKYEYGYNADNHLITRTQYNRNNTQWVLRDKIDYEYDANNNLVSELGYSWDNAEWILEDRRAYTYDANNNQLSNIFFYWDVDEWVPINKMESGYDANDNLVVQGAFNWEENQWIYYSEIQTVYNSDKAITSYVAISWNVDTEQWVGDFRYERTYDVHGNNTLYLKYEWGADISQWRLDFRNNYNYDDTYTSEDLITSVPEIYAYHKRINYIRDTWDTETEEWIADTYRGIYYYSEQVVGIENATQAGIQIFPNPADSQVFFNLPTTSQPTHIQLYDEQGKLADIQQLNNNQISVKHLNTGVYFYQLFHDNNQYGGTLMVK